MNPELQRNLWLEAPRRQIVLTVAILALGFAAVWLLDRGHNAHDFVVAGGLAFAVTALVWGPREARASVTYEVYNRTWDFQRLSAISPWTMTWGKLAGSTVRPWMFAAVALVVAFLQLASISSTRHALFWVLVGLGAAVLLQATGMAVGLIEIRKARALGRLPGLRSPGLSLLIIVLAGVGVWAWGKGHVAGLHVFNASPFLNAVFWWGAGHDRTGFAAVSLIGFAAFAVLWAWRLMRLELQFGNAPWAWLLFVVCLGLYAAGFENRLLDTGAQDRLRQAALAFAACAYVAAFVEPADRVRVRGFASAVPALDLGRLWRTLPTPVVPTLLALLTGSLVGVMLWRQGEYAHSVLDFAMLAFFMRDLGLIVGLRFSARRGGGDAGVIFALALTYLLGGLIGRLFGGQVGAALFWPSLNHAPLSLAAGLGEGVLLWAFAVWRITQLAHKPPTARSRAAPPSPAPASTTVPVTEPAPK